MSSERDLPRGVRPDPWARLRGYTQARIALGRAGNSLPTDEVLRFGLAHAQARDAVHLPLDRAALAAELDAAGFASLPAESAAPDREHYLRRPDHGRQLAPAARERLLAWAAQQLGPDVTQPGCELLIVVADGLSALAAQRHALPLLTALRPLLPSDWRLGPVVIAQQARVALGDEIGACLRARTVAMLIGERPGLSSPDSLGIYLTWAPRPGRSDAERNCLSNIRPEGLPPEQAARKLAWLANGATRLGLTGVGLKDDSDTGRLGQREKRAVQHE